MPDNTPQGTVETTPIESVDDRLERFVDDPVEDTVEGEPGPDATGEEEEAETPDDDSEEADDAEAGEEDQPSDKGRFAADNAKVRLADGTVVTISDLKQGSLRQSDYTRKTQEVAEQRRTFDERNRRVEQLESQLSSEREWTLNVLQSMQLQPPDRSEITRDPIGYQEKKAAYDEWVASYNALWHQNQEANARRQTTEAESRSETIRQGTARLLDAVPELKNPQKAKTFQADMLEYGTSVYGLTTEELGQVSDPRLFHIASDAIKWRKLQAQKSQGAKKIEGKPPVTPGRRQEPKAAKVRNKERDRQVLRSTGGRDGDGAAALDRLLDDFI